MFAEVRKFDWDAFSKKLVDYYLAKGYSLDLKFGVHGEDLKKYSLVENETGTIRDLSSEEAYKELKEIFTADEKLKIVGIYKAKENMFNSEQVYLGVEHE